MKVYEVPERLVIEALANRAPTASYACDDPEAVLFALDDLVVPPLSPNTRGLDSGRLRDVIRAMSTGSALPAVTAFKEPEAGSATLLDGAHRWYSSKALGYKSIPVRLISREHAEAGYQYARSEQ